MDPIKIYDYLTSARGKLFEWVRPLAPEDYLGEFPIGLGTVGRTLTHIMICEWFYLERIRTRGTWDPPPYEAWPIQDEKPPAFAVLEAEWRKQAERSRSILRESLESGLWGKEFEYRSQRDDGRRFVLTVSPADIFTQVVVHETHHRAQVMFMLRQLGIAAQDLDPVYLMYKRREE